MATRSTTSTQSPATILFFLTSFLFSPIKGDEPPVDAAVRSSSNATQYLPSAPIHYRPFGGIVAEESGGGRRMLAPFQLCLLCRCCAAGDPANCTSMPCCFGINCSLRDKPYGVCAFVPKMCDCTSCA